MNQKAWAQGGTGKESTSSAGSGRAAVDEAGGGAAGGAFAVDNEEADADLLSLSRSSSFKPMPYLSSSDEEEEGEEGRASAFEGMAPGTAAASRASQLSRTLAALDEVDGSASDNDDDLAKRRSFDHHDDELYSHLRMRQPSFNRAAAGDTRMDARHEDAYRLAADDGDLSDETGVAAGGWHGVSDVDEAGGSARLSSERLSSELEDDDVEEVPDLDVLPPPSDEEEDEEEEDPMERTQTYGGGFGVGREAAATSDDSSDEASPGGSGLPQPRATAPKRQPTVYEAQAIWKDERSRSPLSPTRKSNAVLDGRGPPSQSPEDKVAVQVRSTAWVDVGSRRRSTSRLSRVQQRSEPQQRAPARSRLSGRLEVRSMR